MKKNNRKEIVPFNQKADFFYRVGIKYANRRVFDLALRYLERAVKLEPFNADFQFNKACVLSELKESKASNQILMTILKEIDPTVTECYFGMGCNYFDMGNLKKAKEYFEKYIYFDPKGQFVDETYDILYYLQAYEDVGPGRSRNKNYSNLAREGRELLGAGEFSKARAKLEKAIEINPEALEPRNDLSVTLFCLGEENKAISVAKSVLKLDAPNITAHCNLLLFYASAKMFKDYNAQHKVVSALDIGGREQFVKLLDTYIKLEDHIHIIRIMIQYLKENHEPIFYHLVAIALYNLKQYRNAGAVWESLLESYPQYQLLVDYCAGINEKTQREEIPFTPMEYTTRLPEAMEAHSREKLNVMLAMENAALVQLWNEGEAAKEILLYFLYEASREVKQLIAEKLVRTGDPDLILPVKSLIDQAYVPEEMRSFASKLLGIKNRRKKAPAENREPEPAWGIRRGSVKWRKEWDTVINCAVQNKEYSYQQSYKQELKSIWLQFIDKLAQHGLPMIKKSEIWAAALEYIYCSRHQIQISKRSLAKKYNVSAAAITNTLKTLDQ